MARVTISDVAKAAGVSMKSVSRVINREPNVSIKLRDTVQQAIEKLGYVPDLAARSLAGSRAFAIGILFDNPSPNYIMNVQSGAYQACREQGYHLIIEHLDSERADVGDQLRTILLNARLDGFLLTPPLTECAPVMDVLEQRDIPYIRIAPVSFPDRSSSVMIDDEKAASEMAHHLWQLGHRRFGLVNGPREHGAAGTRRRGFLSTLAALGCDDVIEVDGGFRFDLGIEAGKALMQHPHPPTAIFATNDDSAAGVMSGLAQMGRKIPDDVSVAGFDDSWIAKSVWPYLTTVHQPISAMAHAATTMLIKANGDKDEPRQVSIDYALVPRESTAPPRAMS